MRYPIIYFILVFTIQIQSQNITNKLGGNNNTVTYDVTDSADKVLMSVQGDGKVGIGTTTLSRLFTLDGQTDDAFMSMRTSQSGSTIADGLLLGIAYSSTAAYLWNYENSPLYFGTNNNSQMTISADGNVGIGDTSPDYKLDVNGTLNIEENGTTLRCMGDPAIYYNNDYFSWGSGGNFNVFWKKVGINTSLINYMLEVNGTAGKTGGGSWSNSSDIRLKDIKEQYTRGLEDIIGLNPVTFQYKKGNARELPDDQEFIGFIAQEAQEYFPEAVNEGKDDYLDFNMHPINVAVINAIKELSAENKELKKRIEKLENR